MRVPFDTAWNSSGVAKATPTSPEQKTKSAGYMTVQQQVQAMQAAGQQLQISRSERYNTAQELEDPDFYNGIPDKYKHLMQSRTATQIRDVVHMWRRNELAARQLLLAQSEQQKKDKDSSLTQDPNLAKALEELKAEIDSLRVDGRIQAASDVQQSDATQ